MSYNYNYLLGQMMPRKMSGHGGEGYKLEAISIWISSFFLNARKNLEISLLLVFIFGLFSNSVSAQGLPLQDFSAGIPSTWTVAASPGTLVNNWIPTAAGGYLGTPGVTVNPASNSTVGTKAEYFLITPQFNAPKVTEIRFLTKQGSVINRGTTYELRLSTTQPFVNNFVTVQSWTENQLNVSPTEYEEKVVTLPDLPDGTPVYLAFVAVTQQQGTTATNGDAWFVDNVRVIESCAPVQSITSTMSATGGVINWTHPSATKFELQIVLKGQGIGPKGIEVDGTSYTATGLKDGTEYDVYIKSICDSTTGSLWAGPYIVKTSVLGLGCATPIVIPGDVFTSPYVLASNLANYYSETDYTPYTTVGTSCFPAGTSNQLSGNHVFFEYTPTTTGLVNITQTVVNESGSTTNCSNAFSSVMVFNSCADVGVSCLAAIKTEAKGANYGTWKAEINDFYVEAGHTYVIVMSSPFQHTLNQNAGICFTFSVKGSACPSPSPSGTTYNNLTQTGADFSWKNNENLVSTWNYVALPVSSGAPTPSTPFSTTTTNVNNPVTGLAADTSYNLFVRAVCGGTPGVWAPPLVFKTPCSITALPYHTGFENAALNSCWSQLDINNDGEFFTFGPNGFNEPVAKLRTGAAGNNTNDMLVSPQFHLDGVKQKRLRFKYNIYGNWGLIVDKPTGGPGSFEVKISTTGVGAQNFTTTVLPLTSYTTAYNLIETIVALPNITGDINIAWILPNGANQTGTWFYLDDVYIEDLPDCSEPSYPGITEGSVTTNSAEFYWTNGINNSKWEIKVQPLNSGVPTTDGVLVETNPYIMPGLTSSTRYEYYVRAYCSDTKKSVWIGPAKFNTVCDAQPVPYFESFDDTDVATKKFCWSVNNKNEDKNAAWVINAAQATIRPQDLFMNPFVSFDDYLISAQVNVVGTKMLKFKYKVATDPFNSIPRGNFEVLMSSTSDFANPKVLIPSHEFTNGDFLEDFVIFEGEGPAYFAFHVPPTMNDPRQSGIVVVDDFSIDNAPACSVPSLLTASSILTNSAVLSWKLGYKETKWEVAIQSPNSGVPTGSGTVVNTNPTYNATALTENTLYEYYVRAVCSSGDSEWVGPFQFRTICNVLPTPFIETFETDSSTESCWTITNNNDDANIWDLGMPVTPIFGEQMAALDCFKNGNNEDWLITPTLAVKPNQRLRFYYKSKYDPGFLNDLKVQLSTNGVAIDQFSAILYENSVHTTTNTNGTLIGSNTITVASGTGIKVGDAIYISDYPFPYGAQVTAINGSVITMAAPATKSIAGPLQVIFSHEAITNVEAKEMVINLTGITAPTNINIAFHVPSGEPNAAGNGLRGSYLNIDNVIVEDIPACPSVYNVTTNDKTLTDKTVAIDWKTAGSETSWEISVQPFGTPAPVGNTLPEYLKTATAHPYTITGLTPSTKYQYYVRPVCSGTSQWVGPIDLLTKCDLSDVCKYTISLTNGSTGQVYAPIDVMQNGVVYQTLTFPPAGPGQPTVLDYEVFLCSGIEFSLYWGGSGSGIQYSQAQVVVKNQEGNPVFTSPLGIGKINTTIFTGVSTCKAVTCAQPTNLTVNNMGVLSWEKGGSETQWEVFVQPLGHGSIPQSGVIVTGTPSYTPVASDFALSPTAGTNEFFVRAVCSESDKSYWTGPKVFIKNDEPATAIALQVNTDGACTNQGTKASFIGATASTTATSCGGVNGGDIWYEFVAASNVHTVELSNFNPGSYYASSYTGTFPTIILSLYEVQNDGSLVEKACSESNTIVASYSSELTAGKTYKIRVKYNGTELVDKKFDICVSTPAEICDMNAFNYSFEEEPMNDLTSVLTIIHSKLVPGWRTNTDWGTIFVRQGTDASSGPYEGSQYIQLAHDPANTWNPADIKGLYKDIETPSEVLKVKYSFASASRVGGIGTTVELWAGPPAGPFTKVTEHNSSSWVWKLVAGNYVVPADQPITRFIFRVKENAIGHLLDAANFKANNDILTKSPTIPCSQAFVTASAEGTGQWIIGENNPAETVIESPASQTTVISGFNGTAGVYTYYWKTRYCEKPFTVTIEGVTEMATTTSPVKYCLNDTPTALTATAPAGFTLLWFTTVDGSGEVNAPTPSTATVGTTTYYVSLVNEGGCIGPKQPIEVVVNDFANPVLGFNYDKIEYCHDALAPVITKDEDFTSGGTFTATPVGLAIDAATGAIDLSLSTPNVEYTITYSVAEQDCHFAGSNSVILKVDGPCGFIQKGISPGGKNNSFELTAMNVKRLEIFNRYGTEVYSLDNYTNQWHGQTNDGEDLPDGTYFYQIHQLEDNKVITGWVYINRKQ